MFENCILIPTLVINDPSAHMQAEFKWLMGWIWNRVQSINVEIDIMKPWWPFPHAILQYKMYYHILQILPDIGNWNVWVDVKTGCTASENFAKYHSIWKLN